MTTPDAKTPDAVPLVDVDSPRARQDARRTRYADALAVLQRIAAAGRQHGPRELAGHPCRAGSHARCAHPCPCWCHLVPRETPRVCTHPRPDFYDRRPCAWCPPGTPGADPWQAGTLDGRGITPGPAQTRATAATGPQYAGRPATWPTWLTWPPTVAPQPAALSPIKGDPRDVAADRARLVELLADGLDQVADQLAEDYPRPVAAPVMDPWPADAPPGHVRLTWTGPGALRATYRPPSAGQLARIAAETAAAEDARQRAELADTPAGRPCGCLSSSATCGQCWPDVDPRELADRPPSTSTAAAWDAVRAGQLDRAGQRPPSASPWTFRPTCSDHPAGCPQRDPLSRPQSSPATVPGPSTPGEAPEAPSDPDAGPCQHDDACPDLTPGNPCPVCGRTCADLAEDAGQPASPAPHGYASGGRLTAGTLQAAVRVGPGRLHVAPLGTAAPWEAPELCAMAPYAEPTDPGPWETVGTLAPRDGITWQDVTTSPSGATLSFRLDAVNPDLLRLLAGTTPERDAQARREHDRRRQNLRAETTRRHAAGNARDMRQRARLRAAGHPLPTDLEP